jgi:four helix bundle protein
MATIRSFRDLVVWQEAISLAVDVYELTRRFPKEEMFGLTQQIRRASVSVSSNIAEGWGRSNTGDYIRYLCIADGSLREVESQSELSYRLGYLDQEQAARLQERIEGIGRMLHSLRQSLEDHR